MRIWSLHPSILDRAALIAGWREALLAQKVLQGGTKGYRNHPQLTRFKELGDPVAAVVTYLHGLADEADARGYRFDRTRIVELTPARASVAQGIEIPVTTGQLDYELTHLRAKVSSRAPDWLPRLPGEGAAAPHPIFVTVPGGVEEWEVV